MTPWDWLKHTDWLRLTDREGLTDTDWVAATDWLMEHDWDRQGNDWPRLTNNTTQACWYAIYIKKSWITIYLFMVVDCCCEGNECCWWLHDQRLVKCMIKDMAKRNNPCEVWIIIIQLVYIFNLIYMIIMITMELVLVVSK